MITLLYNRNDYEAANLALKVQALGQSQSNKVFIVPKHLGRVEEAVYKNLNKTKAAIFIANEASDFDEDTAGEINFLLEKGVHVDFVLPEGFNEENIQGSQNIRIYNYNPNAGQQVVSGLAQLTEEHSQGLSKKQNKTLASAALLTGLALVLLGINASK